MVILLYGHVRTPPWCHEFCRPGTHRMPQLQRFLLEDMDVNDPIPSHRVRSFSYWNQSFFSRNHLKPVILQFSQFSATQWLDPTPITRSQSLQIRPDCLGFHGADISILRPWRWEIWKTNCDSCHLQIVMLISWSLGIDHPSTCNPDDIGIHQNQHHHVFSPRGVALNPSLAEVCEANGSNSSAEKLLERFQAWKILQKILMFYRKIISKWEMTGGYW